MTVAGRSDGRKPDVNDQLGARDIYMVPAPGVEPGPTDYKEAELLIA